MTKNNAESQIKGKCQMASLVESVDYLHKALEKNKKTRKEKDEILKNLKHDITLHGVKEDKNNENTDQMVMDIIKHNEDGEELSTMESER